MHSYRQFHLIRLLNKRISVTRCRHTLVRLYSMIDLTHTNKKTKTCINKKKERQNFLIKEECSALSTTKTTIVILIVKQSKDNSDEYIDHSQRRNPSCQKRTF